ncbi:nucleotidyltransferase domain-containing protein [Streptomyces sp. NPDC058372]|uniref:nucleotidyltransferase domain-containing protein n=1 Tax=Streptomyces sp. NPDC058372 TaxID=3346464 RepID=UPI00364B8A55
MTTPETRPAPAHDPAASALRLVEARYGDGLAAVLGGSAAGGRFTARSDLDIAVLLPDDGRDRRETVHHEGRSAEVYLNTPDDLRRLFAEGRANRRATMAFLYADAVPLHDPHGLAAGWRREARELIEAGPGPLTDAERDDSRYLLTDLAEDLADTEAPGADPYEQLALADRTLREAAHLLSAVRGAWNGAGKWLPRRLRTADPVLGAALLDGHLAVARRTDPDPLCAAAAAVLGLAGGPLREGLVHLRGASGPGTAGG